MYVSRLVINVHLKPFHPFIFGSAVHAGCVQRLLEKLKLLFEAAGGLKSYVTYFDEGTVYTSIA